MNLVLRHWRVSAFGFSLLMILYGCVVAGGGYDGDGGAAYVGGYYEPSGYVYGGWSPGYHVGPPRGGERPPEGSSHHDRSGPSSHPAPSIPTRHRGR